MADKYIDLINELIKYPEVEWLEFKDSWYDPNGIGEYISALSNAAVMYGKESAYLIWGISDNEHQIIGTDFDSRKNVKGEPLEHFLARQLEPSIAFEFHESMIDEKKVVVLTIPSANEVPTAFAKERYLRIGSSKEKLLKYPEREANLWFYLRHGKPTIVNTVSTHQNLSFEKLLMYYGAKGIKLSLSSFEKNLKLKTEDGKYNMLARLLADENDIPVRISTFSGKTKADRLYSVKEYGNTCILYAMDKVLEFGETINIIQADERDRVVERKDIPFFNDDAFREAVINAFLHNSWIGGNAPMISVFSDRIEIVSHGGMPDNQTFEGFFEGLSRPVNEELATIFLQLRISERSGRGVPKVVEVYGKEAYSFGQTSITVTIPFNRIKDLDFHISTIEVSGKVNGKVDGKVTGKLNKTQKEMISEIRNNPNITIPSLAQKLNMSVSGISKNIYTLQKREVLKRIGSDKSGYWELK